MENINYQQKLDSILDNIEKEGTRPGLLMHACCAPCSSYVLEYLSRYFDITVFYYNPNISPEEEYHTRVEEIDRFIHLVHNGTVKLKCGDYDPKAFYDAVRGMEDQKEGEERCYHCYELRLHATAKLAREQKFDYFTTTLSISPYKNAHWLNEIGVRLGEEYQVPYLISDFKKKNGYKRSIELSAEYGLYRQDYCGCIYSKKQREREKAEKGLVI